MPPEPHCHYVGIVYRHIWLMSYIGGDGKLAIHSPIDRARAIS